MPWFSFTFVVLCLNKLDDLVINWHYLILSILVLSIVSWLVYINTYRNRLPETILPLCLWCLFMSIFWIWVLTNFVIDTLKALGIVLNIKAKFMGLTFLALGNSIPDLMLNTALASQGFGEMAISGSIAGPLFNLLFGFAFGLLKQTLAEDKIDFNIFTYDHLSSLVTMGFLAVNFIRLLVQGILTKHKLNKLVSYFGLIIYVVYLFALVYCEFIFVKPVKPE